jgi:hypothetical protein
MEDDVYFDTHEPLFKNIEPFLKSLDSNQLWCCCLGYLTTSFIHKVNKNMVKINSCQCMHAYIIPKQTAIKLSQLKWNNMAIDFAWLDCIDVFYAPYPMIAFQNDHMSTIVKQEKIMEVIRTHIGFKKIAQMGEEWGQHCLLFYSFIIILIVSLFILCMVYYQSHII